MVKRLAKRLYIQVDHALRNYDFNLKQLLQGGNVLDIWLRLLATNNPRNHSANWGTDRSFTQPLRQPFPDEGVVVQVGIGAVDAINLFRLAG